MVDPQVSSVANAVQQTLSQRDVRGIAILGGVGALGVIGAREVVDRLGGRFGITADPTSAQDHAINGIVKILFAALLVMGVQRTGLGTQALAIAAVLAFGFLVSAGGNAIDAIGRTRLREPLPGGSQVRRSTSSASRSTATATTSGRSRQPRASPNGGSKQAAWG